MENKSITKNANRSDIELKHGMRIRCKIHGQIIDDARVSIDPDGGIFICQNYEKGSYAKELFGYKYSWYAGSNGRIFLIAVSDIKIIDEERQISVKRDAGNQSDLIVGDVLNLSDSEWVVLEIFNNTCVIKEISEVNSRTLIESYESLESRGYTIKDTKPTEEVKRKFWRAENGGKYYTLLRRKVIYRETEKGSADDDWRYKTGNYFRFVNDAREYRIYLDVKSELEMLADWNGGGLKYGISLTSAGELLPDRAYGGYFNGNSIWFRTADAVDKAIDQVGKGRVKKYLSWRRRCK